MSTNYKPLISIIIVVYNAEAVLEETLFSIFKQAYKNIELIIIDGFSTDDTLTIIKKHEQKISHWISEPDNGVYDAMNKGANIASGNYLYFLGAGDLLLDVISAIAPLLIDRRVIYYGDVFRTDLKSRYGGYFSPFKLSVKNICHQAIFYPLDVFKNYKYNVTYKMLSDYNLNMCIYGDKRFSFKHIPFTIALYQGGGISDSALDYTFYEDKMSIIKANFSWCVFYYAYIRARIAKLFKLNAYHLK
ncbi:MAG: glycosyltransferase family 2 protein [Janthinobacterium lividum]